MFSGGMDVVLKYRTVPAIVNDSLSKRTMKVFNSPAICGPARGTMVSKVRYVVINDDGLSGNP